VGAGAAAIDAILIELLEAGPAHVGAAAPS
jgi:hypothetical protein